MKAENLMIGDWVNLYGSPIKISIDDLCFIDRDETYDKGVHCKPIPLTEEILEKNGFTSVEDPYNHKKYFLLGKNEYNCNVYWDGLAILLVEEDYEPTTYAYICDVEYVHELQHALKLCNIKKEIVLCQQ